MNRCCSHIAYLCCLDCGFIEFIEFIAVHAVHVASSYELKFIRTVAKTANQSAVCRIRIRVSSLCRKQFFKVGNYGQ